MSNKIYQLPLDSEFDKDILDWLDAIPRARKAEMVRTAIRTYVSLSKGGPAGIIAPPVAQPIAKKAKDLSFDD